MCSLWEWYFCADMCLGHVFGRGGESWPLLTRSVADGKKLVLRREVLVPMGRSLLPDGKWFKELVFRVGGVGHHLSCPGGMADCSLWQRRTRWWWRRWEVDTLQCKSAPSLFLPGWTSFSCSRKCIRSGASFWWWSECSATPWLWSHGYKSFYLSKCDTVVQQNIRLQSAANNDKKKWGVPQVMGGGWGCALPLHLLTR